MPPGKMAPWGFPGAADVVGATGTCSTGDIASVTWSTHTHTHTQLTGAGWGFSAVVLGEASPRSSPPLLGSCLDGPVWV